MLSSLIPITASTPLRKSAQAQGPPTGLQGWTSGWFLLPSTSVKRRSNSVRGPPSCSAPRLGLPEVPPSTPSDLGLGAGLLPPPWKVGPPPSQLLFPFALSLDYGRMWHQEGRRQGTSGLLESQVALHPFIHTALKQLQQRSASRWLRRLQSPRGRYRAPGGWVENGGEGEGPPADLALPAKGSLASVRAGGPR